MATPGNILVLAIIESDAIIKRNCDENEYLCFDWPEIPDGFDYL